MHILNKQRESENTTQIHQQTFAGNLHAHMYSRTSIQPHACGSSPGVTKGVTLSFPHLATTLHSTWRRSYGSLRLRFRLSVRCCRSCSCRSSRAPPVCTLPAVLPGARPLRPGTGMLRADSMVVMPFSLRIPDGGGSGLAEASSVGHGGYQAAVA